MSLSFKISQKVDKVFFSVPGVIYIAPGYRVGGGEAAKTASALISMPGLIFAHTQASHSTDYHFTMILSSSVAILPI